jgi:two-component system, sensor histidine kinase PdtaS
VETAARHLRLLSDVVAAATSTLELEEVLQRVAVAVDTALETDACFVYELDRSGEELVLGASVGSEPRPGPTPRMRVGEGITGHAAELLEPIAIAHSAHLDPRFRGFTNLDERAFESILAVPVLARGKLAGALNVRTYEPREYDDEEVALLLTIAAQVGQAIENARLWGRSQRRIAELEALDRIARVVHSPIDLDEALADVVRTAAQAAHADVCALALPPSPGQPFEVTVRSSEQGATSELLADAARRAPLDEPGLLAVPLETRRGRVGALVCARLDGPPFTRAERALLGSVAAQAATAVVGARGAMRSLLAQEIHHRVKNNLQTVASLLRLAASSGSDPHRALRDSVGRVLSIAEVHDLLTSTHEEDVDGADLIRRLGSMLCQTVGGGAAETTLAPIVLRPDRATALALVYCELYANAVEHGGGVRHIVLKRDGAFAQLSVTDAGPGPAPVAGEAGGQGLTIARALVESDLAGSLQFTDAAPGVRATVRFPLEESH